MQNGIVFEKSFNELGAKKFISPRINTVSKLIILNFEKHCHKLFLRKVFFSSILKKRILDQKFQKQKLQIILKILVAQDFDANLQEIININQV